MPDNFNDIELNLAVKAFLNDETLMEDIKRLKESMNSEVNTLSFKAKVSDKNIKQLTEQLIEGSEKALADNPVDIKVHYSEMEEGFKELKKLKDNLQKQLQKEYDNFLSNKTSYIDYEKMGDTKLAEQYRKKTGLNAVKIEQLGKQLLDIGNILNKVNIEVPNLNLGSIKFNFDKIGESINNINNFLQAVLNQLSMEKFEIEDMIVQENKDIIKAKKLKTQKLKSTENNSSKDNTTDKEFKKGSKDELAQKYYLDSIDRLSKRYEEQQKKLRNKEYNWKNSEQVLSDLKDYYETTNLLKLLMKKAGIKSIEKNPENKIPAIYNEKFINNQKDIKDKASKNNITEQKINEIENEVSQNFENIDKIVEFLNKINGKQEETVNSIKDNLGNYINDTSKNNKEQIKDEDLINITSDNINQNFRNLQNKIAVFNEIQEGIKQLEEEIPNLSGKELKSKQQEIKDCKEDLADSGKSIINLFNALNNFVDNAGEAVNIDKNTMSQIGNQLEQIDLINPKESFINKEEEIKIKEQIGTLEEKLKEYGNLFEEVDKESGDIYTNESDLSETEKRLKEVGEEIVEIFQQINKFLETIGKQSLIDSEIIDTIPDIENDLVRLNERLNNAAKTIETVEITNTPTQVSNNNNTNSDSNITSTTISQEAIEHIQQQLNVLSFTIYINRALLSENFNSEDLQSQLDNLLSTNPIKVEFTPKIGQNNSNTEETAQPNNLSVSISNINFANEQVVADIKSRIETALSPIVINNIEISQKNIDNIKEQIKNALYTFTIDKIEFAPEIDIDKISDQINTVLSSIQMPTLDYSPNAKALKTELENALAQIAMPNDSISSLIPNNTINDLDTINKMSSALENLKRAINNINRAITRLSQNIEDRNSGIVKNMEADMSKLQNLIDQVDKLKQSIDSIGNIKNIVVTIQNRSDGSSSNKGSNSSNNQNTNNSTTSSNNFDDYYVSINKKISELNKAVDNKDIDKNFAKKFITWLNNLKKGVSDIENGKDSVDYKKPVENSIFENLTLEAQNIQQELEKTYNEIDTSVKDNKITNYYNTIDKDIQDIEKAKVKIGTQTGDNYISQLNEFKEAFEKFQNGDEFVEFGDESNKELLNLTQTIERYKTLLEEISNIKFDSTVGTSLSKVERNYNNLIAKVKEWGQENDKALKDKSIAYQYNQIMSELADTTDISAEKTERLSAAFNRLNAQALVAGKTGRSFSSEMKHLFNILGDRAIVGSALEYLKDGFREMLNNTREIDAAMTELKKVTDNSGSRYAQFLKEAGTEAKDLGSTIADLTTSTAGFAKLGYNIDESQTLAKNAIVYSNVGDLDIETATNDLVSATKAFGLVAEDTGRIVDSFNEVGNRFAVSAKQLGEGLTNSASTLAMSGNSMDESIAMLTAMTEVTQDASSAGAALKIFALRIRGAKTELNELGEDTSDMATSTSKLREEIKGLTGGFDIMIDDSTFKSTMEIARGLSEAMENMNDIDTTALLEKIAGKNRANQIGALLSNFSQAEKALEVSKNSAGSAAKENAAYIDSIQGRINQMKAAFEDLSIDFFDSEDIKLVVQGLTKVIELVDKLVEVTGGAPLLAFGLTSFINTKGGIQFEKLFDGVTEIPSLIDKGKNKIGKGLKSAGLNIVEYVTEKVLELKELGQDVSDIYELLYEDTGNPLFKTLSQELKELEKNKDLANNVSQTISGIGDNAEKAGEKVAEKLQGALENAVEAGGDTADSVKDIGESAEEAGKGVKALGAGFKALIAQAFISFAVWGITKIIESIETVEKLKEKVDEAAENYKNVTNELENVTSHLEDNKKLIEEINSNPLTITSKEDLKRLQDENALLETQKKALEFEEKSQKREVAKATTEFLNKSGYSYSRENGVEEHKWLGKDTYLEAAQKAVDDYSEEIKLINSLKFKENITDDMSQYADAVNALETIESHFGEIERELTEQQQNLSESSEEYKTISQIMSDIVDKQQEFSEFNLNNYVGELIKTYSEQDAKFINNLNDFYKGKKYYAQQTEYVLEVDLPSVSYKNIVNDDKIKEIFNKNGFNFAEREYTGSDETYATGEGTLTDIFEIYQKIVELKQRGIIADTDDNRLLEEALKNQIGFQDVSLENMRNIAKVAIQAEKLQTLSEFFENSNDYNNFSDVNAEKYFEFVDSLKKYFEDNKIETEFLDSYLSSIFPSYQDINSWLMSYYNEGHTYEINELINDVLFGGGLKASYNIELQQALGEMGYSADEASKFLINLANAIAKEKAAADKAKSQEIKLDFNTKKSDFDENANSTLSMFESAINSAQSAFSNQATVAYEDMWTMIQTDESLVNSFTKTTNGYTISVDALREAKERYIATQKRGFETTRQDALELIRTSEQNIEEANKILKSNTASDKDKSEAQKRIQEEKKVIAEQEIVIAKSNLMNEEINNKTIDYTNTLDEITSKLSSWEAIYQSIINDISKINKLSSSTLKSIMQAAPNNWQDMVYLDDNNQIQADQQKLFEFANQDTINKIKDQQGKLSKAFSEQVNSTFKSKYNLDLGVDFKLTDDYEKNLESLKKNISNEIQNADIHQLSSIEGGVKVNETLEELTPNLNEASEGIKIFIALLEALFGEFEENKALADFNSDIEEIQHSLSMGNINQAQYNSAYAGKVSEFENAVYANGTIDDPEVKDQLNQMYETIHTNQQNELNKQLEKEKQSIQDAYDQRLITAEQYYSQLAALEDRYYGTKDSKGLLDDTDGTNVDEKIREQIERRKQIYEDQKALLQENYDRGLINFDDFETGLNRLKNQWLNIPELKVTFDEESYNNIDILYEAELAEIEKLSEQGVLTNTQTAGEMRRIWEKYYKDKEGFAKQSYEAEKRYLEAAKNDIQTQINGIQALIDINEENINAQIKIIEEQNDEITKAYDEQIDLIDKQIKAIDEQIDAIKDKADEEDRYYKIQKAEEELRNASQRTRMVYGSDGTITYRVNNEKYNDALKNYNDAKRDLVVAELEKQKDDKEKEKEVLEEAKEAALEINNTKIEELNNTLNDLNNPLEDLVTILSANLAETYGIDPEVIQSILGTDASKLALDQMNKAREAQGGETTTTEDLAKVGEEASEAYQNQTVSQATKDEQIKKANENVTKTENGLIKVGEGLYEVLENLPLEELNSNLAALLSSNSQLPSLSSMFLPADNSMLDNTINPKIINTSSENMVTTEQMPNTFNIGDIVINSPVGDSNDLAKELRLNLQNAFEKQMYSNLK